MSARENREDLRENKKVAQKLDPGWVRRDRLERIGMAIAAMLAMGAIVVAIVSFVQSGNTAKEVHKFIQKTPCATSPAGKKCTRVKERIAKEGAIRNPCIEHQRVTGHRGANCPRFFIPPTERATGRPPAATPAPTATPAGEGAATSGVSSSSGEVAPSVTGDGGSAEKASHPTGAAPVHAPTKQAPTGEPDESGSVATAPTPPPAPAPTAETPPETSEASAPSTNPPVETEQPAASPEESTPTTLGHVAGGLLEGTIGEVGEDVGGLVEGTCERTEPLLHVC